MKYPKLSLIHIFCILVNVSVRGKLKFVEKLYKVWGKLSLTNWQSSQKSIIPLPFRAPLEEEASYWGRLVEKMFARAAAVSTTCCLPAEVNCCRILLEYWNKQTNEQKNKKTNKQTNKETNISDAVSNICCLPEKVNCCRILLRILEQTNKQTNKQTKKHSCCCFQHLLPPRRSKLLQDSAINTMRGIFLPIPSSPEKYSAAGFGRQYWKAGIEVMQRGWVYAAGALSSFRLQLLHFPTPQLCALYGRGIGLGKYKKI